MNLIDDSYDFNQFETNVMHKLERHRDEKEFGIFPIGAMRDQAGKENRKLLSVRMGRNGWETEFQIYCASPVSFISPNKLHELKIQDRYLAVKSVLNENRNVFSSATDDVIKIIGPIVVRIESEG